MTDYFRLTGQSEEAVACGERALTFATGLGDFSLQIVAQMMLGHAGVSVNLLHGFGRFNLQN
jgi:hypothetical protein